MWATKKVLIDPKTSKVRIYDEKFAKQHPNLLYTQILHNGMCLTTPFHLQSFDENSIQVHTAKLEAISKKGANNIDAQLKLESCRPDAHGQLWKVIKATHSNQNDSHGFALRERDSGYCLRPDVVKAHTKKEVSKEVNAVFYPCSGVAHSIFEIQTPSGDLPVWYDHNGVIKSDNGFCLDVPNDPKSNSNRGSIVFLQKCVDDEYDRWDYVVDYDKTVKIINDFTGNCLYPYKKDEGVISNAQENQLVQKDHVMLDLVKVGQ